MKINFNAIPQELRERRQWVLWKNIIRDGKGTKVPFQPTGVPAKSNDANTWSDFETVVEHAENYNGIGYMFSADDPYCGIDLDACRDTETGLLQDWAKSIVLKFASYAEVSPSETGVKIWIRGKWNESNHKIELPDKERVCEDKQPAIEVYDSVRYFAMTGIVLRGHREIRERQPELDELHREFWGGEQPSADEPKRDFRHPKSVFERARRYLEKIPAAVSGQNGHGRTYHAACVLCLGFELDREDALELMREYSQRCDPPWTERELEHKVDCALRESGERGYLRNVDVKNFDRVPVPEYKSPAPKPETKFTTLKDAAILYVETLKSGQVSLVETGLPELDHALGGGVQFGEMMLLAARPSHGKSMCGLQMVHNWTWMGLPCAFISEEMSALSLGKRTVQFASSIHQEHWSVKLASLETELQNHFSERKDCVIVEQCRTAEAAAEAIRQSVDEHGVKCVVVDYAQLLTSSGRGRYEQVTNTSIALRQVANETGVLLVALCQLGRDIEKRPEFHPYMSDLKDSGQLEQDADVVVFVVWPHRIDQNRDPHVYQFFVGKNRNREILAPMVECHFNPTRQMLTPTGNVEHKSEWYEDAF